MSNWQFSQMLLLVLVFIFLIKAESVENVDYNVQETWHLAYDQYTAGEILFASIGFDYQNNPNKFAGCEVSPSTYNIIESEKIYLDSFNYEYDQYILTNRDTVFILSQPNHLTVLKLSKENALLNQRVYEFGENDSKRIFPSFIKIAYDCYIESLVAITATEVIVFNITNTSTLTVSYVKTPFVDEQILAAEHANCGIYIFSFLSANHSTSTALKFYSMEDKNLIFLNKVDNSRLRLHESAISMIHFNKENQNILIVEQINNKILMLKPQDDLFSTISIDPSYLYIQNVHSVYHISGVIFGAATDHMHNQHQIFEYQLDPTKNHELKNYFLARKYSISSFPLSFFITDKILCLATEDMIVIIRHSIPVDLVDQASDLMTKYSSEGEHALIPFANNTFIIKANDSISVGDTFHENPYITCTPESNVPLGYHLANINLIVASGCSLENKTCQKKFSVYIHAYKPLLGLLQLALILITGIALIIITVVGIIFCANYINLKKNYHTLKEQSVAMSHIKYGCGISIHRNKPEDENILPQINTSQENERKNLVLNKNLKFQYIFYIEQKKNNIVMNKCPVLVFALTFQFFLYFALSLPYITSFNKSKNAGT